MSLTDKLKKVVLPVALLGILGSHGGCVINAKYSEGNERVQCSGAVIPGAGAATVKHDIYETSEQERIKCAFDSSISGVVFFGGAFEMKVYAQDREFLWKYRIEPAGREGYKVRVWGPEEKASPWVKGVPRELPVKVNVKMWGSSLFGPFSGSINYRNIHQSYVDPERLLEWDFRGFVESKTKREDE